MSKYPQHAELAFNRKHSRFKLQMYFGKRPPITHYGNERSCTISQITNGRAPIFRLDKAKGYQDCLERIELCLRLYKTKDFRTAMIYDKKFDKLLYKLVGDEVQHNEAPVFDDNAPKEIQLAVDVIDNTIKLKKL